MESRTRSSPEQFLALLDFMESRGDISRPQTGPQGRIKADQLWQELVSLLNSIGGGVIKSMEKWKKVWADWKTKTKKKALAIRIESHGTGGGPSSRQSLTDLELRVLSIMGLSAVDGLAGIEERGFDDQPSHSDSVRLDIANELNLIPIDSAVSTEGMSSASPLILPPPSDFIQHPPTESPPRVAPASAPAPLPPTSPPVASTSRGEAQRRRRERTASPARRRERPGSLSPTASTPRRRALFTRRRRVQTPFERATREFVAVENRRLQLEEDRERNLHRRETEMLRLESRRLDIEENRNIILTDIAKTMTRLLPSSSSLPSTDILSSSPL